MVKCTVMQIHCETEVHSWIMYIPSQSYLIQKKLPHTQLTTVLYKWKEITWGVLLRWILPGVKEFAKLNPCNKLNNMPPKYLGRFWRLYIALTVK